jgi:hypothetical protein
MSLRFMVLAMVALVEQLNRNYQTQSSAVATMVYWQAMGLRAMQHR